MKIKLLNQESRVGLILVQTASVLMYIYLRLSLNAGFKAKTNPEFAIINFIIQIVIMAAISYAWAKMTEKKPPKPNHAKPTGLEQFDVPTAEESRPIQVLFGKKYIAGPNVIWYGDLFVGNIKSR